MKTNPNDLTSTLTKREWLTGMALQGIMANSRLMELSPEMSAYSKLEGAALFAQMATEQADATITNLNKTNPAGTADDTHV